MPLTSDSLVSTKLRPSQARPKLVARPTLIERLNREAGRKLTLVSAPAGFGKTTLLSKWFESRADGGHSVAWLTLDKGDNDPFRFLSYLVATLRSIEEGIGEGVLAALRTPEPPKLCFSPTSTTRTRSCGRRSPTPPTDPRDGTPNHYGRAQPSGHTLPTPRPPTTQGDDHEHSMNQQHGRCHHR